MAGIDVYYDIELGILIHQLPNQFVVKALKVLPKDIKHRYIDESGMRVYFSKPNNCNACIRKKFIVLDGIQFNIYSTVTCLTIFGISSFASKRTIELAMKDKSMPVFNLYQVLDTSQYRIILDVPEVLANFELSPISLDPDCRINFPIEFYCRICRNEGHKQYQCLQLLKKQRQPNDTINTSVRTSSNNARTCDEQENDIIDLEQIYLKASVSGTPNTGGTKGLQSFGNFSAQENANVPKAYPSTSSTLTAAESLLRTNPKKVTGSKKVVSGTARNLFLSPAKDIKRSSKQEYPCVQIVKVIKKVRGILSPKDLRKFLEVVFCKKKVIEYADKFVAYEDIPELITQIHNVIIDYYQQRPTGCESRIAKKHIKIIEDLHSRLDENWRNC